MPSSNWRLIRGDGADGGDAVVGTTGSRPTPRQADRPPTPPVSAQAPGGGNLFRGRGRAANHSSGQNPATAQTGAQAGAAAIDQGALAEEIRRIERVAEERGYENGRRRAEAELQAAIEGAGAMAQRMGQMVPDRTSEIAHSIAELALTVAKRIIQHEVRIEPSLLCASLEAAVSTINGSPEAHVLLNPSAIEPVHEAWEALHGRAYLGKKWIFEGDPTLPIGGCTLRYDHGFVEAGLEAQLEEIGIALDRAIPGLSRGSAEEDVA
jgi:flagellar biosynthesis/type III secretory pathway protein FliH